MIERVLGKPDMDEAMTGALAFAKLESKTALDKEILPENKEFLKSLSFAKAMRGVLRVDKQGDLQTQKLNIATKNNQVKEHDLFSLGVQALLALEAVTVPLPGQEVSHEKPWKAQRKLMLGALGRLQPAVVDVTYTLHGIRDGGGKQEAIIFLKGEVRGDDTDKGAAASALAAA